MSQGAGFGKVAAVTEQPVLSDDAQRIVAASQMLSLRRLEYLPISGDGSPIAEAQGRTPGDSTSVEGLQELISSIATIGVLQPILVEDTEGHLRLLAGERRLLACRWLQTNEPENPHIVKGIPAVVTPGPISETERRAWEGRRELRTDRPHTERTGRGASFSSVAPCSPRCSLRTT